MPRSYNAGLRTAVASNYQLPDCVVGAVEILTYFPNHLKWPEVMFRLYRAGFRPRTMARGQLVARGTLTANELSRRDAAIRHQLQTAGQCMFGANWAGATQPPFSTDQRLQPIRPTDYPLSEYPNGALEHYDVSEARPLPVDQRRLYAQPASLRQLAEGVVNIPRGRHQGLVTQAIEWARLQNWVDAAGQEYTTEDIPRIAQQQGFRLAPEAYAAGWDELALSYIMP